MLWVINLLGLLLLGLIIWWFWGVRPQVKAMPATQPIEVLVADGVYVPAFIGVPAGQGVTLHFLRKDPSPCAEKVIFAGLGISADLALNSHTEVTLPPLAVGEYEFTCQMQMYRGRLKVTQEM
ncbi:MAG: cupredoxin domain-containing protein [Gammaproteobacteria bacterium]|nr:cupredoxin domain-containing protein [Gammaproteobacteria bacterium]